MPTKNISITKEAYDALQREKRDNESFTRTILRLTRRTGKLSDSFGAWNSMSDKEEAEFEHELSKGWKHTTETLKRRELH
jgi:predicted CopG family antitoxin